MIPTPDAILKLNDRSRVYVETGHRIEIQESSSQSIVNSAYQAFRAAVPLVPYTVVKYLPGYLVGPASCLAAADALIVAGIVDQAYQIGDPVIIVNAGTVDNAQWSWVPTVPIMIGCQGDLTQSLQGPAAFERCIAVPITPTSIVILPYQPVIHT